MKLDIKNILPNAILNAVIFSVIALGLFIRLYFAKNGIIYHIDDDFLMYSIRSYSYFDILHKHLLHHQASPLLYTITLKFLYSVFGFNHHMLGGISLFCSCMSLILMPVVTYKICKNKFAALITLFLLVFNPHILHYTFRIKHYSIDIFMTIFLIWAGFIFFSNNITKRKIFFLTVICIICGLYSYTSCIMSACLFFYYLFLFEKDNIKTKITNLLISVIPCSLIFIPLLLLIYMETTEDGGLANCWSFYFTDFEGLKNFIYCMFGGNQTNGFLNQPQLTFYYNFWYLFFPIIFGILIIFIKRDKYLFSVLILPLILAWVLGVCHIYPLCAERVSLWLSPIFMLLFVIPAMYIKFNKKIIFGLISIFIIAYYCVMCDRASIDSIKSLFNGYSYYPINYFSKPNDETNENILLYLISDKVDWNIFNSNRGFSFDKTRVVFDWGGVNTCEGNNILFDESLISKDDIDKITNIYFYLYKDGIYQYGDSCLQTIKENSDIIYEFEDWYGNKLIKAKKIN